MAATVIVSLSVGIIFFEIADRLRDERVAVERRQQRVDAAAQAAQPVATEEQVTEAFKILIMDKKVQAILVNIFGGIMKCDVIAQGIINAAKTVHLSVPLVVRLEGTNVEKGKCLLKESGVALITADDLADAAQKAVEAASSKSQAANPK